jgi:uncharacterized protein (TIGR04255 family)
MKKVKNRLSKRFPLSEPLTEFSFALTAANNATSIKHDIVGYKLYDASGNILQITPNSLVSSVLAPYTSWEQLVSFTIDNISIWRGAASPGKYTRIGIRYINRIDIPAPEGHPVRIEDYLNIYPSVPDMDASVFLNFALQVVIPFGFEGCIATLNSGGVDSPLLEHVSFVLDTDIYKESDLPEDEAQLEAFLARVRPHKNALFESLITDKARALFA